MEVLLNLVEDLLTLQSIGAMLFGIVGGMVIGALPGLSANMGIALLLPVTFVMNPLHGLLMLLALYTAAIYGGSIPAILLHTPGTSASGATAIDGYPLTLQGESAKAIRVATVASVFGGLVSAVALLFLTPLLSRISLLFGPPEYFLLAVFGLTAIASVSSGSIIRGLISGGIGLLLATIGQDLMSGYPRYAFGFQPLQSGISVVPAMIGLFAFAQVLSLAEKDGTLVTSITHKLKNLRFIPTKSELKDISRTVPRSSLIGVIVGMLPGAGANIASWIAYSQSKSWSRKPEEYGKGSIEGIAASESANNAATGSSLIPLLTLGVPGSASAAVLLGALLIQGLVPGRELFTVHARFTYGVLVGFLMANILLGLVAFVVVRYMTRITKVPSGILIPVVASLCVIGSFSVGNNLFDVWIMVFMGILGYIMNKIDFSPAAVLLGLILGPIAERGFRQTLTLAGDSVGRYVFTRPVSIVLILLIILAIVITVLNEVRRMKQQGEAGAA